jgi:voltage-gated potassium channel
VKIVGFSKHTIEEEQVIIAPQYEIFVLAICFLQLINSLLIFIIRDPEMREIARIVFSLCGVLLILDCIAKFLRRRKMGLAFRRRTWLLLLGSFPLPGLVLLRIIDIYITGRTLRREDVETIAFHLVTGKAISTFLAIIFIGVMILEFASMAVLASERRAGDANILTGQDAIWWSFVTIATVGYGDRYPVTTEGRVVGVLAMTVGVGVFSVLTSLIADWFRRPRQNTKIERLLPNEQDFGRDIEEIYALLEEQENAHAAGVNEIRTRLKIIERLRDKQP